MGGSPDCMKNPLAWAPVMNPSLGPTEVNCSMCLILSWGRIIHGSMMKLCPLSDSFYIILVYMLLISAIAQTICCYLLLFTMFARNDGSSMIGRYARQKPRQVNSW